MSTDRSDQLRARPILVVDDDPVARNLLTIVLHDAGYAVVTAGTGEEALQIIDADSASVVLLDIGLPDISGLDVLAQIRSNPDTQTLPVILATAADDLDDRVLGLRSGADDYVTKPFDLDEVVARVGAQLRHSHAWATRFEQQLMERAALARTLTAAASQPNLTQAARAICREVTQLNDVAGAAMVRMDAGHLGVVIAQQGDSPWDAGVEPQLPSDLAQNLQTRSYSGPWIEGAVAYAPINHGNGPLGLLALRHRTEDDPFAATNHAGLLSTAVDVASVIGGALQGGLAYRRFQVLEEAELTGIISTAAFEPYFQPIVSLADRQIIGYEALTRFADHSSPADIFERANTAGLGIELELATLCAAITEAQHLPEPVPVSLNVSPVLLCEATEQLAALLSQADRAVTIELTEHDRVDDYDRLSECITRLPAGTQVSVDDAGSGFSSLRHILTLKPAYMKLDASWVRDIDSDPSRQALVAGLCHFAHNTGVRLIAEGIETVDELTQLIVVGVRYGQGFLLGMPAPVKQLA